MLNIKEKKRGMAGAAVTTKSGVMVRKIGSRYGWLGEEAGGVRIKPQLTNTKKLNNIEVSPGEEGKKNGGEGTRVGKAKGPYCRRWAAPSKSITGRRTRGEREMARSLKNQKKVG